MNQ
ncbi:unnamed protein product [Lactuca saligna]|jgi:hypothetical protein